MKLALLALLGLVSAEISICSTQNTGSSDTNHYNLYQSNGYCKDQCAGYSFAIVEGTNCWCSNVAPGSTIDLDNCQVDCPGYPAEKCGDSTKGYFAYLQLGDPSSTAVGSSSTSRTTSGSTSITVSSNTVTSTSSTNGNSISSSSSSSLSSSTSSSSSSTVADDTSTTISSVSATSSSSKSSSSSSTTGKSTTSSVAPITSIVYSIQTITGSQATQVTTTEIVSTIVSLPTNTSTSGTSSSDNSSSSNSTHAKSSNGFFDSPGKVAGTFTAVGVVIVALIGSLIYFCCFAKRRHDDEDTDLESNGPMSNEKLADGEMPIAPGPLMSEPKDEPFSFVAVDQRLDPRQMFMKWENGSKNSLGDHQDYSRPRVLRVTNANSDVEE